MSWADERLCAFDLETTGTDPFTARIVTAAVAFVGGGQDTTVVNWLVNPGVPIPEEAAAIHGITTEKARAEGMPPIEALGPMTAFLRDFWANGLPVIIFNASFDLTVLDCELRRHGQASLTDGPVAPVIDPMVIDRHVHRYRKGKRTLADCCRVYDAINEGAHGAGTDAVAAARVAWRIGKRYPEEVGDVTPMQLHEAQAQWHREWAEEFEVWLKGKKRQAGEDDSAVSIEREWPLRTRAEQEEVA